MHPTVFEAFDHVCGRRVLRGASVLEIGATPDPSSLLNLPSLAEAAERIGVDQSGAATGSGYEVLRMNANDLSAFANDRFDVVLCNSVLEHDPRFWLTLAEVRRVIAPGGLVVFGAPGFAVLPKEMRHRHLLSRIPSWCRPKDGFALQHSTLTLGVHNYPADYYRFGEAAFREVVLEGYLNVEVTSVLVPPRFIGSGVAPG